MIHGFVLIVGVFFANAPISTPFPITIVCAIGAAGGRSVRQEGDRCGGREIGAAGGRSGANVRFCVAVQRNPIYTDGQ